MPKQSKHYAIVLVTCGSRREAATIARCVVGRRLAACVNIFQAPLHSIYWWKGKVEEAREFLLLIKTERRRVAALCDAVERLHSYDVPEFLVLPLEWGSSAYLSWLGSCLTVPRPPVEGPPSLRPASGIGRNSRKKKTGPAK